MNETQNVYQEMQIDPKSDFGKSNESPVRMFYLDIGDMTPEMAQKAVDEYITEQE